MNGYGRLITLVICSDDLGFDFDQAGTNSVMTPVMGLSAKVRRNERVW